MLVGYAARLDHSPSVGFSDVSSCCMIEDLVTGQQRPTSKSVDFIYIKTVFPAPAGTRLVNSLVIDSWGSHQFH